MAVNAPYAVVSTSAVLKTVYRYIGPKGLLGRPSAARAYLMFRFVGPLSDLP